MSAVSASAPRAQPRPKPLVGISSCLLGECVRYDGGHKRAAALLRRLGRRVEWVPVCPELEVGMGVPREPVRLIGRAASPRMVGETSGKDWTVRMRGFSRRRVRSLARLGLDGYIFKARSPSCGPARVKLYSSDGRPRRRTRGVFAATLRAALPHVPIADEERLADPRVCARFLQRVLAAAMARARRRSC